MKKILLLVLLGLTISPKSFVQAIQSDPKAEIDELFQNAKGFIRSAFYAEGTEMLNKAIEIAKENNLVEEEIRVSIELAETMRKTRDFEDGIAILTNLKSSERFPLLHVKKLGRIAAIYHESLPERQQVIDSVTKYINLGLEIANQNQFEVEQALLLNEYGYLLGNNDALPYHLKAAELLLKNGDHENYVVALTKVLGVYQYGYKDYNKSDSIIKILQQEFEGKDWHIQEAQFYTAVADFYALFKNDSLNYYKWGKEAMDSHLSYNRQISSERLDQLRVVQETMKFQNEAKDAELALLQQKTKSRNLTLYVSIMAAFIILGGFLFFRELRLKAAIKKINEQLKHANKKYEMLMIESNHRIKNNLQMIISMMEYEGAKSNRKNLLVVKNISRKIHTISALHKHLYTDVHNEKIGMNKYFEEVVRQYSELSNQGFKIDMDIPDILIRSERIVYFGLIFNELLTNTLEHSNSEKKLASIRICPLEDDYSFEYQDDSQFTSDFKEGSGISLIKQLIQRIGGFDYQFNTNNGNYKFTFSAEG